MSALPLLLLALTLVGLAHAGLNYISDGIFVGDQAAAADIHTLQRTYNVSAILNVAWDLDIRYPTQYYVGDMTIFDEHLAVQYHKVDSGSSAVAVVVAAPNVLCMLRRLDWWMARETPKARSRAPSLCCTKCASRANCCPRTRILL